MIYVAFRRAMKSPSRSVGCGTTPCATLEVTANPRSDITTVVDITTECRQHRVPSQDSGHHHGSDITTECHPTVVDITTECHHHRVPSPQSDCQPQSDTTHGATANPRSDITTVVDITTECHHHGVPSHGSGHHHRVPSPQSAITTE